MRSDEDLTAKARIRDAALELFARADRVSMRSIASRAGVSPALVVHHYASMEGLREACDAYVVALTRGTGEDPLDNPEGLGAMLEAAEPVRRYLARRLLDGSQAAGALFDEIVDDVAVWLERGSAEGWARPTADPRARAAVYVTWLIAPMALGEHLARVLGVRDIHDMDALVRYSRVSVEMLSHGVFSDERVLRAWKELS